MNVAVIDTIERSEFVIILQGALQAGTIDVEGEAEVKQNRQSVILAKT